MEQQAIAIFGVGLTAVAILHSLLSGMIQRRLARRERAAELYSRFYSSDNYRRVVAPVYRLMMKWRGLPEPQREPYRAAVRLGWLGVESPAQLLGAYCSEESLHDDPERAHFRDTLPTESFTEHEALTTFLYFWNQVDELVATGLIDRTLFRRLFKSPFEYYRGFLAELRDDMKPRFPPAGAPAWIAATERLERLMA